MKFLMLSWLAMCTLALADGGISINPVLVQVFNQDSAPVAGATVNIDAELDQVLRQELNPESEFKKLGKAAPQTAETNALGHALVYGGGSWGPIGDGKVTFLRGKVEVTAPGYKKALVKFERKVGSEPEGSTELTLKVVVTLEKEPK